MQKAAAWSGEAGASSLAGLKQPPRGQEPPQLLSVGLLFQPPSEDSAGRNLAGVPRAAFRCQEAFAGYLRQARAVFAALPSRIEDGPTGLSPEFEALRWFPLPAACLPARSGDVVALHRDRVRDGQLAPVCRKSGPKALGRAIPRGVCCGTDGVLTRSAARRIQREGKVAW